MVGSERNQSTAREQLPQSTPAPLTRETPHKHLLPQGADGQLAVRKRRSSIVVVDGDRWESYLAVENLREKGVDVGRAGMPSVDEESVGASERETGADFLDLFVVLSCPDDGRGLRFVRLALLIFVFFTGHREEEAGIWGIVQSG